MILLRAEAVEDAEKKAASGRDTHGEWGRPPPAHVLKDLPWADGQQN